MKTMSHGTDRHRFRFPPRLVSMIVTTLLFLAMLVWVQPSHAAPPLAGTSIGNQASATYTDSSNAQRTATSNTVQTIIQQVAGLTLTATQAKPSAPGGTVYFPHTLTNTGNGSDTFSLGPVGSTSPFTFTNIAIYADANGDGVPDNSTPITSSGPLAAGSSFKFIVAATVPPIATDGQSNTVTITATSTFGASPPSANNIDTANVSGLAVIAMTKTVSPGSGNPGSITDVTYTLTYTNTGNATATNLVIKDAIPTGMTYKSGDLARWSVTGATALTDNNAADIQGTAPNSIIYDYAVTTPGTVTATIAQVQPSETRTLTFVVNVAANAVPGVINNSASFSYGGGTGANTNIPTNTASFMVNQSAGVIANGSPSSNVDTTNEPITIASAPQGSTVRFDAYIWNTGNGSDSFDITVINTNNFPVGTSFVLYKSDGVTPLIDTNSNSIPDTGPLASGASYNVVVKVILPAKATSAIPVGATLTATSKQDNTKSNPAILTLTTITTNTVDLTLTKSLTDSSPANIGNTASTGFGPGPAAVLTPHNPANPGATTSFVLKVNNTSPSADTYNLAASTDQTFNSKILPTGWTVTFKADGGAGDCTTSGAVISNTGVINAGTNATVCAIVSIPSDAMAGTQEIDFQALSPSSGANDPIRCAVDVNVIRAITVTSNQTGQVFPGGTVVYQMKVTNNGNVLEGSVPTSGVPNGASDSKVVLGVLDSLVAQGWNSVVYYDATGNGIIDPADPVVIDLSFISKGTPGLDSGESVPLLVKVFAPAGAATGDTDVATLTATTTGAINVNGVTTPPFAPSSATDTSTVISGQVTLTKTQALDAACDGTADTSYGQGNITVGAIPGACILYKIAATNVGIAPVQELVISDSTPANTVYNTGIQCPSVVVGTFVAKTTVGTITAPTQCTVGAISASIGALNPGSSAEVSFGIQISK